MGLVAPALALAALVRAASGAVAPSVKLNNGVEMPLLSYGANLYPALTCRHATTWALQNGFRFIWSSEIVGEPCQKAQWEAIVASGLPRSEIFVAGTVNTMECRDLEACYQQTKAGAEKQFGMLGSAQLDMLMLDYPSSVGCVGIQGQWKALEELYAAKRVRTIAVSNFKRPQLQCIADIPGATMPSVNQMRYNVGYGSSNLLSENQRFGVVLQAYSPLGAGEVLRDPALIEIGQAIGRSPAQVALRWLVQQGVGVNVASTDFQHLREDASIFDFELSPAEMARLGERADANGVLSEAEAIEASLYFGVPGAPSHGALGTAAAVWLLLLPGAVGVLLAMAGRRVPLTAVPKDDRPRSALHLGTLLEAGEADE